MKTMTDSVQSLFKNLQYFLSNLVISTKGWRDNQPADRLVTNQLILFVFTKFALLLIYAFRLSLVFTLVKSLKTSMF